MKRIICLILVISIAVTSTAVPALARSNPVQEELGVLESDSIEVIEFDSANESVLDAIGRMDSSIDLAGATVMQEVDANGNMVYVVETAVREIAPNEITLADMALAFLNDPTIYARLEGNTLTYILPDGTTGTMTETIDRRGVRTFHAVEGEKSNVMVFDAVNQQVLVDGGVVTATTSEVFVIGQADTISPRNQWIFHSTSRPDVQFERAVSTMTTGTVVGIMTSVLSPLVGIPILIVANIISFMQATSPEGRSIHVTRRTYRTDWAWVVFRHTDRHYANAARTQFINQRTWEQR